MPDARVLDLLASRLGMDFSITGTTHAAAALTRAVRRTGCETSADLLDLLRRNPAAWDAVVDEVVVGESWFFRDWTPFAMIVERARAAVRKGTPLRVLSAPCSTGEEPYSIAMGLLGAGVPASAFSIDAIDVSARAIACARAGRFRSRAVMRTAASVRRRFFAEGSGGEVWQVAAPVQRQVRFHTANLVTGEGTWPDAGVDVIFCRNLLIYLHAEGRARVIQRVRGLLAADGVLIVGAAESGLLRASGFVSGVGDCSCAFTLPPKASASATRREPVEPQSVRKAQLACPASATLAQRGSTVTPPVTLDMVRRLADGGAIGRATEACLQFLRQAPTSADAHLLLALLRDAAGEAEASAHAARRALYLEPEHVEALVLLAAKHEQRGDRDGAARLRARAARLGAGMGGAS